MKYDVHLFPVIRVKIEGVVALSQVEAIEKAGSMWNPGSLTNWNGAPSGYADEISHFLVDEVGDEEHLNSQFYEADGKTPLADARLAIGVEGGAISSVVSSTSKLKAVVVMDYDTDNTPPAELKENPTGQKCFCYPFEVGLDPDYVEKCFAALEQTPGSAGVVQRIRDILFLDIGDDGKPFINPDKEWEGADTLDRIAAEIRKVGPIEQLSAEGLWDIENAKKLSDELMQKFVNLASKLRPESRTNYGGLSPDATEQQRQNLLREWGLLEIQAGRKVSEDEAWDWNSSQG